MSALTAVQIQDAVAEGTVELAGIVNKLSKDVAELSQKLTKSALAKPAPQWEGEFKMGEAVMAVFQDSEWREGTISGYNAAEKQFMVQFGNCQRWASAKWLARPDDKTRMRSIEERIDESALKSPDAEPKTKLAKRVAKEVSGVDALGRKRRPKIYADEVERAEKKEKRRNQLVAGMPYGKEALLEMKRPDLVMLGAALEVTNPRAKSGSLVAQIMRKQPARKRSVKRK